MAPAAGCARIPVGTALAAARPSAGPAAGCGETPVPAWSLPRRGRRSAMRPAPLGPGGSGGDCGRSAADGLSAVIVASFLGCVRQVVLPEARASGFPPLVTDPGPASGGGRPRRRPQGRRRRTPTPATASEGRRRFRHRAPRRMGGDGEPLRSAVERDQAHDQQGVPGVAGRDQRQRGAGHQEGPCHGCSGSSRRQTYTAVSAMSVAATGAAATSGSSSRNRAKRRTSPGS